jgi:hypothetical protein
MNRAKRCFLLRSRGESPFAVAIDDGGRRALARFLDRGVELCNSAQREAAKGAK